MGSAVVLTEVRECCMWHLGHYQCIAKCLKKKGCKAGMFWGFLVGGNNEEVVKTGTS